MKKIEDGIFRQDDGRYMVHTGTRVGGKVKPFRRRGVSSLGEARLLKEEFLVACAQEKERLRKGVITLSQAIQEYLHEAETRLRPSTWLNVKRNLEAHSVELSERYIDTFTAAEFKSFITKKFAEHSVDTRVNQAKFLRQVFQLQMDKGVLQTNPLKGVNFKCDKLKKNKLECLTKSEVRKFLDEAYRIDHPWKDIFFVTYHLGLRSGEAYELKFSDIDFENGFIVISRSFCFASKTVGPPKNRETRTIPLNRALTLRLKELKLAAKDDYILPKHPMWRHGEAAKVTRSFLKDLGLREVNFHSLRASFITHLLLDCTSTTKVQHMVSHADLSTTQEYIRLVAADLKGATESLSWDINANTEGSVLPFKPRA